jgi:AcrR family transcriptional regulator
MARNYRLNERAKAQDETRERIVQATMALHDEQGVAATSFTDVARRAGIGAATVYRHFATIDALVAACGAHVWAEMRPPVPELATAVFEGVVGRPARLLRLVDELDAFYHRGALRLHKAAADREAVPGLDEFLKAVEAGVVDLVREAVKGEELPELAIALLISLTEFPVWQSLQRLPLEAPARNVLHARLLAGALEAAAAG